MPSSSQPDSQAPIPPGSNPQNVVCDHCGLPVPPGLVDPEADQQFCCNGCRSVYEIIHSCGLDRFYRLRESAGEQGQKAKTTERAYAEFDDPVFRDLYDRELPDGHHSVELYLDGIHCSACVWLVEKLPSVCPGVLSARLSLRQSLVEVIWDESQVKLSRIAKALDTIGYPPHPAKDAKAREARKREDHRFLIQIGVAAACAGNVMTIAFALYGGDFSGMEPQYERFFRWVSLLIGLVSLLWPGRLFFKGALAALRTRTAHLDLPIALALSAGTIAGLINTIRDQGDIYFDSLTMLIFLLLVGRWIQRRQQRWAADAVELLYTLTPSSVRVLREGQSVEVPIEAVQLGEIAEVRAGESIAIDGEVVEGHSTVDQSLLTGESRPIQVKPGDEVAAGTNNIAAQLRVRVLATGAHTRVGRLMQLVERGAEQRAPIVYLADRIAGWFVGVLLMLAGLTFGLWLWLDPAQATEHMVALLIVTCPCALGLATPLTVTVAIGQAAKRGLLVKGGDALERLARPGKLVLDKTGTVTAGRITLTAWHGDEPIKPAVVALEAYSSHPLAMALVDGLKPDDLNEGDAAELPRVTGVEQTPGSGIAGTVAGKRVLIGSPAFLKEQGIHLPASLAESTEQLVASGQTPVQIAADSECVAVAGFRDPLAEDAIDAVQQLRQQGWELSLASGDHPAVVQRVGQELGLAPEACHGGMSPEDKLDFIRSIAGDRTVVMAGDGVNDAAALAAADVGLAVHGSAQASLAAADVYLSGSGLMPIVALMQASRRTIRAIWRALGVSLAYNLVASSLAIIGIISPLVAAILMPISSLTVLTLALTTRSFKD
jgi:Cu2+-exporting ATPase